MREGLDQEAATHDGREGESPFKPAVGCGADDAADRDRRRQQTEADGVHPEDVARVQDEHTPRSPVGDVERDDREREGAHRGVGHQPPDTFDHLCAQIANVPCPSVRGTRAVSHDTSHEDGTEREANGVRGERQGHADGEQEGTDRRCDELVGEEVGRRQPRVRDAEISALDDLRRQALSRDVREDLCGPQDEERAEHDQDVDNAAGDRRRKDGQDRCPGEVDPGDDPAPVDSIRDGARWDPEQKIGQLLAQDSRRNDEGVACLRRDQQRTCCQRDPIADVRDDRRCEQPAEASPEPGRHDRVGDGSEEHRRRIAGRFPGRGLSSRGQVPLRLGQPTRNPASSSRSPMGPGPIGRA